MINIYLIFCFYKKYCSQMIHTAFELYIIMRKKRSRVEIQQSLSLASLYGMEKGKVAWVSPSQIKNL